MSQNQTQTVNNFINLHAEGIGYLQRVRLVTPKKAKPFLAASVSAMHGEKGKEDGVTYVNFDVRVSTAQATEAVELLQEAANDKDKRVLIGFKIGDFYIDSFTRTQGNHAGETATLLKGRLIEVKFAKVDGESVYKAPARVPASTETDGSAPEAPAAEASTEEPSVAA